MEVVLSDDALKHLDYWKKIGDKIVLAKIKRLIDDILSTPYTGIGKPEPLKHNWSGYWSRRITNEHRMVYKLTKDKLVIVQLRYHY